MKFVVRQSGKPWPIVIHYYGDSPGVGDAQDLLIKGHDTLAIIGPEGWRSFDSVNGYLKYAKTNVSVS